MGCKMCTWRIEGGELMSNKKDPRRQKRSDNLTCPNQTVGCQCRSTKSCHLTRHDEYLNLDGQKNVVFVKPSLVVSVMNFKRWNHGKMDKDEGKKSSYSYILQAFKSANDLKEGDQVEP
ncbi:hypothetical protein Ddye_022954 [Dipteronia dyeriana]|uniref:Uncharacterized protein n=1 Tax=Dipteronia dyeriana TaxID=168575 RepID=A0AAD9WRX6_9ROSI|nr:hypothetical protein Ddye_022954 [Dipteronia dyeriana]